MIRIIDIKDVTLNNELKKRLFELMIHAYAETESDIWGSNYHRLEAEEYYDLLDRQWFLIAFKEDKIVGSIHVYRKDADTFGFGLLNADFEETGQGIGQSLIIAAEEFARKHGANTMQLEILRASSPVSEFKKWLAKWYENLGYAFTGTYPFEYVEPNRPDKRESMITEAVFDIYRKSI